MSGVGGHTGDLRYGEGEVTAKISAALAIRYKQKGLPKAFFFSIYNTKSKGAVFGMFFG
jgi:hypothetical protein